jgi:hypothetical protein
MEELRDHAPLAQIARPDLKAGQPQPRGDEARGRLVAQKIRLGLRRGLA